MIVTHSLGLLQVLVRQMQPGANHQNAEVHVHICHWPHVRIPYSNTGINISADMPILIGASVIINCTTDSPADSITLLQNGRLLHGIHQSSTILTYNISLVTDNIYGNTFKCEAKLTGRTNSSDTVFDMVIISLEGKSILIACGC